MKRFVRVVALLLVILTVAVYPAMAVSARLPGIDHAVITVEDVWFDGQTTIYDNRIAQASMGMALAAYQGQSDIEQLMTELEFENLQSQNYGSDGNVGYTVAVKAIKDGASALISVVFEDTKEGRDWERAFDFANVGTGKYEDTDEHPQDVFWVKEWACAAESVILNYVHTYVEHVTDYSVLIAGSGRGGSVANYLGMLLDNQPEFGTDRVRCYAFGAPAVSTQVVDDAKYDNLFTINNPDDFLTYLPFKEWGYQHYGVVIEMDTFQDPTNQASASMQADVTSLYKMYTDKDNYFTYSYSAGESEIATPKQLAAHVYEDLCGGAKDGIGGYYNNDNSYKSAAITPDMLSNTSKLIRAITTAQTEYASVYYMICLIISNIFGELSVESIFELLRPAAATYLHVQLLDWPPTDYYPIIDFALQHSLGIYNVEDISALADSMSDPTNLELRELVCAYEPESYLAWVMAMPNCEWSYHNGTITVYNHTSTPMNLCGVTYSEHDQMENIEIRSVQGGVPMCWTANSSKATSAPVTWNFPGTNVKYFLLDSMYCPMSISVPAS